MALSFTTLLLGDLFEAVSARSMFFSQQFLSLYPREGYLQAKLQIFSYLSVFFIDISMLCQGSSHDLLHLGVLHHRSISLFGSFFLQITLFMQCKPANLFAL